MITNLNIGIWTRGSRIRRRFLSIIAVLIVAIIVTAAGSFVPLDAQEAERISSDLNQTVTTLQERDALMPFIFGNNLFICLLMFIPVLGPVLGLYIMFNSGQVIGAIATSSGLPPALALIALFITPIAWLEFAAYSAAMAESVWLFRRVFQRLGLSELRKNTTLFVTLCTILLAVGALVETALISIV